ncbi:MAG TPA: 30S ribosomal protein S7 [Candidatus Nanoarchaeia archaeon]|nr:30S ribosomal protein S7 [Candidatus Nanoarchaeia archaeon]
MEIALFGKYKTADVVVKDDALRPYINITPRLLLKSHGRHIGKFAAAKTHLVERLANRIAVPGHVGKKHKVITSWASGKYNRNMRTVIETLDMIEQKKKESPIQVLVRAVENAAPRDETTTIEYGGARYPQAVDVSPLRRINLVLRWMVQGAYQRCFGKKTKMAESLAKEIILASESNMESFAMSKKNDAEKQADSAR